MKKTIGIWIGVNKNGYISMHLEIPIRNVENGKWVSNKPYINSKLYDIYDSLLKKANITWEHEAEFFEVFIN